MYYQQFQPQPTFPVGLNIPKQQLDQQDPDELNQEDPLSKRIGYLRKLYTMLFIQLIIIGVFITVSIKSITVAEFLSSHFYLIYVCIAVTVVTGLTVLFLRRIVSEIPINLIIFLLFTCTIAVLCSYGIMASNLVLLAYIMTTCIVFSQLLYTFTTRQHLAYQEASLFILISLLLSFMLFLIFSQIPIDFMIFVALAEIVFAFYFIYDTQTVISGAKDDFELEDCISGAVLLYVDIVILFFKFCELVRDLLISSTSY